MASPGDEQSHQPSWEGFGAGWSALHVDGTWVVLEPHDDHRQHGKPELLPARAMTLLSGPTCIVTSDNPHGAARSASENDKARLELHKLALERCGHVTETAGGAGSPAHPAWWPELELGIAVPIGHLAEAVELCNRFEQAAVYVLHNRERLLIDSEGRLVRTQYLEVHPMRA